MPLEGRWQPSVGWLGERRETQNRRQASQERLLKSAVALRMRDAIYVYLENLDFPFQIKEL